MRLHFWQSKLETKQNRNAPTCRWTRRHQACRAVLQSPQRVGPKDPARSARRTATLLWHSPAWTPSPVRHHNPESPPTALPLALQESNPGKSPGAYARAHSAHPAMPSRYHHHLIHSTPRSFELPSPQIPHGCKSSMYKP
jgi:hypothetical protein